LSASLDGEIVRAAQLLRSKHVKLLWDLTIYLVAPNEQALSVLLDLYECSCEQRDRSLYMIPEILQWTSVHDPLLTDSGRVADARGDQWACLEPLRNRLRSGRPYSLGFWDGRAFDDPEGSWSFSFQGVKGPDGLLHSFVRFMLPLSAPLDLMRDFASSVAAKLPFMSGHGGLTFAYDPWNSNQAFDAIYAAARRFWGIDIEYLAATLPAMDQFIKGTSWITMLGNTMAANDRVAHALAGLRRDRHLSIEFIDLPHGSIFVAGVRPACGDRHRGVTHLEPQVALARAVGPLMIDAHVDFPGRRFAESGKTVGWFRRFIEPQGWS
jgi:hypothetical protein